MIGIIIFIFKYLLFICEYLNLYSIVAFYFRVLVMGDGEILEFDEPNLLIQNADSYFYSLANQEFSDKE